MNKNNELGKKITFLFLGIIISFFLLEVGLRISAKTFLYVQKKNNQIKKDSVNILCLGESNTALGGENSYPRQLEEILNEKSNDLSFDVVNAGIPGVTSDVIVDKTDDLINRYDPDIITIMMGITDSVYNFGKEKNINNINQEISFFEKLKIYNLFKFLIAEIENKDRSKFLLYGKNNNESSINNENDNLNEIECVNDGFASRERGDREGAKYLAEKAMSLNPEYFRTYLLRGVLYRDEGNGDEAVRMFLKSLELNPNHNKTYIELSRYYREKGHKNETEELFNSQIERMMPDNSYAYLNFGNYYRGEGELQKAEEMIKRSIEIEKTDLGFSELGLYYKDINKYKEAEESFRNSISVNESGKAYLELGLLYKDKNYLKEAENLIKKAVDLGEEKWDYRVGGNDYFGYDYNRCFVELSKIYYKQGDYEKAQEVLNNVNLNTQTIISYQKIKEKAKEKGIKLVVIQYPTRDVRLLKNFIDKDNNIIFVDNERIFKSAIEKDGYNKYFIDNHGGDFGHCTKEGNYLLAENIAKEIWKNYFNGL